MSLYEDTAHVIADRISEETYPVGSVLPREIDLAKELKVSRNTLRSAMSLLERDGIIERKRRGGTKVVNTRRAETFGFDISSISGVRSYIRNTTATVLAREERRVPDALLAIGGLPTGQTWPVVSSVRVANFSRSPIAAIDIFVQPAFGSVIPRYGVTNDLLSEDIRKNFGVVLDRIEVFLRPVVVGKRWTEALQCDADLPAINMVEVVRATDGSVTELASMIIPQDRMDFTFTIRSIPDDTRAERTADQRAETHRERDR